MKGAPNEGKGCYSPGHLTRERVGSIFVSAHHFTYGISVQAVLKLRQCSVFWERLKSNFALSRDQVIFSRKTVIFIEKMLLEHYFNVEPL